MNNRIRIIRGGLRTVIDEFNKPLRVIDKDVTINGKLYGSAGVTFKNVTGTFRGVAVTLDAHDQMVKAELVEMPRQGGLIR